jgi:hypothetical protein
MLGPDLWSKYQETGNVQIFEPEPQEEKEGAPVDGQMKGGPSDAGTAEGPAAGSEVGAAGSLDPGASGEALQRDGGEGSKPDGSSPASDDGDGSNKDS